jgi:hypothetical protein
MVGTSFSTLIPEKLESASRSGEFTDQGIDTGPVVNDVDFGSEPTHFGVDGQLSARGPLPRSLHLHEHGFGRRNDDPIGHSSTGRRGEFQAQQMLCTALIQQVALDGAFFRF